MNDYSSKRKFGRYQVIESLGKGSTSTVYKAHDPLLDRDVAIKAIHAQLSIQPGFVERFEREARALAHLQHPNIVRIYDMGHEADIYFMVVELVSGETLKIRLQSIRKKKQLMPLREIDLISTAVCDAVDYAHLARLVHRDLKPANVIFNERNKPMLTDFGIVKMLDSPSHTAIGSLLGTPLYMSPEQCKGQSGDQRCDIYSLGVMLYEMCTGKLPFRSRSMAGILKAHISKPPPPPRQLNSHIPLALETALLKALAKDPDDRYQTASELSQAFSTALNQPAEGTMPISNMETMVPKPVIGANLRSVSRGARYSLDALIDNRIGRSQHGKSVEVDLNDEPGSDYVHSVHVLIRLGGSGWELETLSTNRNPTFVNDREVTPGTIIILSDKDRVALSGTELVFEVDSDQLPSK